MSIELYGNIYNDTHQCLNCEVTLTIDGIFSKVFVIAFVYPLDTSKLLKKNRPIKDLYQRAGIKMLRRQKSCKIILPGDNNKGCIHNHFDQIITQ